MRTAALLLLLLPLVLLPLRLAAQPDPYARMQFPNRGWPAAA